VLAHHSPYETQTLNLDAAYTYNNEGSVASTTYPTTYAMNDNGVLTPSAGPGYGYNFDNMYRPSGLGTGTNYGTTVVSAVNYGPSNQLLGMTYNGVTESRTYNSLLQLTSIYSGTVSMQYNYPAGPSNNGKACLATDLVTGEQVAYTYDTMNRLASANAYTFSGTPSSNCTQTSSGTATWSQTYSFDGYGNLWNKVGTGGAPSSSPGYNGANNRITINGSQYDGNGNLTANGSGGSYTYVPENRMIGVSVANNGSATYGYDSQNKRIFSWTGSTGSERKRQRLYDLLLWSQRRAIGRLQLHRRLLRGRGDAHPRTHRLRRKHTSEPGGWPRWIVWGRLAASTAASRLITPSVKTNRRINPEMPGGSAPIGAIRFQAWITRAIDFIRARLAGS
jgi:hypothetical protein